MNTRTYVQGCGYHETAFAPPEVVAEFLRARGFHVEVIPLDRALNSPERAGNALIRVMKGSPEN